MGIASSLFFSTTTPAECLDWRIRPSDEQYDAQKERWNDLAVYLLADLKAKSGYILSSWLQGSYKFGTQVRPPNKYEEFDIDLGVYFNWSGTPFDGGYEPSELKDFVQASLEAYVEDSENDAEGVSAPKPRCNRIHFADSFHIDVPSYHLDRDRDARALATQQDTWEASDAKAIYGWWKDTISDADRPRLRRLVRYLKMWAALAFETEHRPSSIVLMVIAADGYRTLDVEDLSGDDEFLRAVVDAALSRVRRSQAVANPVDMTENLNRLSKEDSVAFVTGLESLLSTADRALAAPTKSQAADVWAEVFHHFFPVPAEEEMLTEMAKALTPVLFVPEVDIKATAPSGSVGTFRGLNSIGPLPKNCSIEFTLANAYDLPAGAIVTWTVRNAGKEAEQENDLGHPVGVGLQAYENSAYTGRHFMDVAVRRNGVLIGHRRVPVTIYGVTIPNRNTARPGWTKFRQKRRG
jgi:hypothetical protein